MVCLKMFFCSFYPQFIDTPGLIPGKGLGQILKLNHSLGVSEIYRYAMPENPVYIELKHTCIKHLYDNSSLYQ